MHPRISHLVEHCPNARVERARAVAIGGNPRDATRRTLAMAAWLCVTLVILSLGCSSQRTLSLEGVWTDKDRPTARFLFRRDGTGRLTDDCSPPNLDIGSGTDFRWKIADGCVTASFKAAGRECKGKLKDKLLLLEPTDLLRYGDGHFLSMPRTLLWFAPQR